MCGIIGFSGVTNYNTDKIKTLLLLNSYERGTDSTGYYNRYDNVVKDSEKAYKFLRNKNITPDTIFIGHARSKTVGTVTKSNAHPFHCGSIILVHNGTLKNHLELFKEANIQDTANKVDSQAICEKLNHDKNPLTLSEIDGAAALLFTDTMEDDVLYVYRNNERPLCYGFIDDGMYISSEEEPLEIIEAYSITTFDPNILYKIKDGTIIEEIPIQSLPLKTTYNNTIFRHGPDFTSFHRKWLLNDVAADKMQNLTLNTFYFCKKQISETRFLILNNAHEEIEIDKRFFSYSECNKIKLKKGDYGKCVKQLRFVTEKNGKSEIALKKDEIVKISELLDPSYEYDLKVVSVDNTNNIVYVDAEYIKPLTDVEYLAVKENLEIKNIKV